MNFPVSLNPGLARGLGTFLKMDFQRAVLNRIPVMSAHPERYFRQTFFICDEYHLFATTGESDPSGDEWPRLRAMRPSNQSVAMAAQNRAVAQ